MKVLLLGATGNLGSRLVPALLTHGLSVTCFVRSAGKLRGLLPPTVHDQITIREGDAKQSAAVKKAILESECDAVVSAAGVAAAAPWGKTDLPDIFKAVLQGIQEASVERQKPIRVWFVAGMGVLNYPGTDKLISSYIPLYVAHRQNLRLIKTSPPNTLIDWSMLCPMTMKAKSSDLSSPTKTKQGKLTANATTPPLWHNSRLRLIPLLGKALTVARNATRYETTLEQNVDFIAADLESFESKWSGCTVGVIDPSK
ncbi:NAD(P)-binding protein [Hortaea werneckii]|uniref:NAD(P)-binding domain-containing protein n=1 Tax=Hortaea werneckii TaxID=91943 RepID=A0A3M7B522_HORWE|nr:NAD(P)-binding protein [Hortaea werneckii]KAI7017511.1 NAD(P)-binding protein [Hortaea werneckii]KAI7187484.1 NAD(P)-binding protein [Hortaea werneckii]KAI7674690.1 NAD(P)-binding protein [Hortaea werneckii]RMY01621.1 hypothetical protein D0868_08397 [Hortaea werneckii]